MDTLDGRRSSRALATLLLLGILSGLAVASHASYQAKCNSSEPAVLSPPFRIVRIVPTAVDSSADAVIEPELPADDEATASSVKIFSI